MNPGAIERVEAYLAALIDYTEAKARAATLPDTMLDATAEEWEIYSEWSHAATQLESALASIVADHIRR